MFVSVAICICIRFKRANSKTLSTNYEYCRIKFNSHENSGTFSIHLLKHLYKRFVGECKQNMFLWFGDERFYGISKVKVFLSPRDTFLQLNYVDHTIIHLSSSNFFRKVTNKNRIKLALAMANMKMLFILCVRSFGSPIR